MMNAPDAAGPRKPGRPRPRSRASAAEPSAATPDGRLVAALRAVGCVFAEDEAAELRRATSDPHRLEELLHRRLTGEPLEYVVGSVVFHGLRLSVGPGAFIPRQRSRLLARLSLAAVRRAGPRARFLEAFAGVGPLAAVVRAGVPDATVHATDIDDVALQHARLNLGEDGRLYRGPVLSGLPDSLHARLDVIAAVPPYVPVGAQALLPREAREREPARALFGGEDGLDAVRELLAQAPEWLDPAGHLLVEMGHAQAVQAAHRLVPPGFDVRLAGSEDDRTAVLDMYRFRRGPRP